MFFKCISCQSGIHLRSLPLCPNCLACLVPSTRLCPNCASPACPIRGQCVRPWIRNEDISSFSSLYFLTTPGYRVLRAWKKNRGPLFDRRVLKKNFPFEFPADSMIIPIPQRFVRSWKMNGSRTERISEWLSKQTGYPIARILAPWKGAAHETVSRQAELRMVERFGNRIRFDINEKIEKERPAILVDDFITTGHTVRRAAELLRSSGLSEIHVFCLGIRSPHFEQ